MIHTTTDHYYRSMLQAISSCVDKLLFCITVTSFAQFKIQTK